MTKHRLAKLSARVQTVNLSALRSSTQQPGKPWAKSPDAPLRLRGRALQERNHRVRVRDACTCQSCGVVTLEGEVDHVIPLSQGGSDDMSNLQWLCAGPDGCHAKKTKREAAQR